jgi:hypothetical protein
MRTHLLHSLAAGAAVLGLAAAASPAASAATTTAASAPRYTFSEHRDHNDLTFNQLLGINDHNQIAGYFGIGTSATDHPNRGYVLDPPYHQTNFANENFPGAAQTQVIGINNSGTTVGFYADPAGDNYGFVLKNGIWTAVIDPHTGAGTVNQLLGLNNFGVAVGFYTDTAGNNHGYEFNFHNDTFKTINIPGATSVTASGINAAGNVTGFYTNTAGNTESFLLAGGHLTSFSAPGSDNTTALGINNANEIVGAYTLGTGASTVTHGFVRSAGTLRTVDDPNGKGTTTINGVNDHGDLVGFYTDTKTNVDGFLAQPAG